MKLPIELLAMAALLLLLAFFSASETSLFSLRPWRAEKLMREQPARGSALLRLLEDPLRLLVTLVVGSELVSIAAGNLSALIRREWLAGLGEYGVALALVLTSAVFVLFGEITPKALAAGYPEWAASRVARPLALAVRALAPLTSPLVALASRLPAGPAREPSAPITEADFRLLVEMGMHEGVLERREVEMIGAVFRMGDLPVRAVMVPRTDILALPASATVEEALAHIRRHRHSRIPLYDGDLDQIAGVLYAKDLLCLEPGAPGREVRALARPAHFVPEMMRARLLIREFQRLRLHMAVVVDEYGGTSGLVSLEDLLEEIVGDITDDYDRPMVVHRPVRKGLDWVAGSLPFAEFKRRFRARARAGDYDTLAGYVLKLFGRLPAEGERVSDGQFAYAVARIGRRRILELMVERIPPGSGPPMTE
jgi:putative hemolysin